jgi:hypothetical protein
VSSATDVYPAALTGMEWEHFDAGVTAAVAGQIQDADKVLAAEFPGLPVYRVPVLFDRVLKAGDRTVALTPNLVNLQFVNGVALIPTPHGPRMAVPAAIDVISDALRDNTLGRLGGGITPAFLRRHDLIDPIVWVKGGVSRWLGGFRDATELAREFADGFPGVPDDEVAALIIKANKRAFTRDGDLRDGWSKLRIPEQTVDLFQAYTHVLLDALGLHVHSVDSWFYHLRSGEIHCGTNVLRRPPKSAHWWDLPSAP